MIPLQHQSQNERSLAARVKDTLADAPACAKYVYRRFLDDQGLQTAASLTYTSLLGLVPLLAVFLAILGAFPALNELREDVREMILAPFAPGASSAVQEHLLTFIENARKLGIVGAIGIGVTAIMLLNTIENTLNGIWRVNERRSLGRRLIIYWALLTLPPILIAASISLSSYFFTAAGDVNVLGIGDHLQRLTPFLMQTAAFAILFIAAPARHVRWRDAAIGGFVAASLFEGLKNLFGYYVEAAGSQEAIYGALAAVPFFLIWIYASWTMILIGAEVAASLPEWRGALSAAERRRLTSGERLTTAVAVLTLLWRHSQASEPVERADLEAAIPAHSIDLGNILERLVQLGHVTITDTGALALIRDLDELTVYGLQRDLGLALEETPVFRRALQSAAPGLGVPALAKMMASAESAKAEIMSPTIKAVAIGRAEEAPDVRR